MWRTDPQKRLDYRRMRRDQFREWVDALKVERGCADCGYDAHAEALDFDHVRGEKLFNIAHSILAAPARVRAEIDKCDVVCANCHRVRTKQRKAVPNGSLQYQGVGE